MLLVLALQGWADSCPIHCHIRGASFRPGPQLLGAWMGARENPWPELLPEHGELTWLVVKAPQNWKCLGVSSTSSPYALVANQVGTKHGVASLCPWLLVLRHPPPLPLGAFSGAHTAFIHVRGLRVSVGGNRFDRKSERRS